MRGAREREKNRGGEGRGEKRRAERGGERDQDSAISFEVISSVTQRPPLQALPLNVC